MKTNKTHTTHSNNVYQNANKHEKVTLGALGGQLDVWDRGWRTEKRSSLKDSFAPRDNKEQLDHHRRHFSNKSKNENAFGLAPHVYDPWEREVIMEMKFI